VNFGTRREGGRLLLRFSGRRRSSEERGTEADGVVGTGFENTYLYGGKDLNCRYDGQGTCIAINYVRYVTLVLRSAQSATGKVKSIPCVQFIAFLCTTRRSYVEHMPPQDDLPRPSPT